MKTIKGLSLVGKKKLQLLFWFTNPKFIPAGIPLYKYWVPEEREKGVQFYENLPEVGIDKFFIAQLLSDQWKISSLHYYVRGKYVVVLELRKQNEQLDPTPQQMSQVSDLTQMVWGFGHVWDNPADVSVVLLHRREKTSRWKTAIAIKDNELIAELV